MRRRIFADESNCWKIPEPVAAFIARHGSSSYSRPTARDVIRRSYSGQSFRTGRYGVAGSVRRNGSGWHRSAQPGSGHGVLCGKIGEGSGTDPAEFTFVGNG